MNFKAFTQILCQIFTTIFMAAYLGNVRPYLSTFSNRQEFLNEVFVLIAAYPLFVFTSSIVS